MTRPGGQLSAVDALARGFVNLRANWELVAAAVAQGVLTTAIGVAAVLPIALVLELPPLPDLAEPAADARLLAIEWLEWAEELMLSLAGRGPALLGALAACLLILTMAFVVYCFLQGGILGVLAAGDRQAPPGRPRGWAWFRTFSLHHLVGWGGRFLWRYFWLMNLVLLVVTLEALLALAVIPATLWGGERWGPGSAAGIGCGGGLLVGAVLLLTMMWGALALADAARGESGVAAAARRGLRLLGERLGATVLLTVLWLVALLALHLTLAPASMVIEAGVLEPVAAVALESLVVLLQMIFDSALGLLYLGALVALVRDAERRRSAAEATP